MSTTTQHHRCHAPTRGLFQLLAAGLTLASCATALADPPPGPDEMTEYAAVLWGAAADGASATVTDDTSRVKVGAASLRFDTDGAYDTWLWVPFSQDAEWDFIAADSGGLSFWIYAENPNFSFQNSSPWIRFHTTENDYLELHATSEILNLAQDRWIHLNVPFEGDASWTATDVGSPDLSMINWIEIHADTWDDGFTLWIDDLTFDADPGVPVPPAYSVTPVLFIPDPASFPVGYQPSEAELTEDLTNIETAMTEIRSWYAEALGLETSFILQSVVRMDAWGALGDYEIVWVNPENRYTDGITIGNTWGLVLSEVQARGLSAGSQEEPKIVVIFCKGAGGFAGGAQYHNMVGGGMCMLGDWCLDSLADRVPPEDWSWWTGVDRQKGATAHEMGHTLGLPHPDILNPVTGEQDYPYTVMGAWWDYPDYPINPADPDWPLDGLHGWGRNSGPTDIDDYNDIFLLDYRADWFQITPDCPGDLDGDGDVDQSDLGILLASYNIDDGGDCDGDGDTDQQDLGILLAVYGLPCP